MQVKSLFSGASDDAFETQLHHLLKQYIIYTLIILCPFDMLKVKRGEIKYSLIVYIFLLVFPIDLCMHFKLLVLYVDTHNCMIQCYTL